MELRVNLDDREEIEAAVSLLQVVLAETKAPIVLAGTQAAGLAHLTDEFAEAHGGRSKNMELPADAAAVFGGGAQPAAPLALSIPPAAVPATTAPPPPANPAPTTTTLGAASLVAVVGTAAVERDARGMIWDSRIHSSAKSKLANGNWKVARGKAPEYVAQVEAELQAAAIPPAAPEVPAAPVVPIAPPVVPSPPAVPVVPSVSADPTTFEQLMPRVTAAVTSGLLPAAAIGAACTANGLASVVALQQAPHFVPLVWASLKQQYPSLV